MVDKILKNSKYLSEYIINSYLYCEQKFSEIQTYYDNNDKYIQKNRDNIVNNFQNIYTNPNPALILDFLKNNTVKDLFNIFTNLLVIDELIEESKMQSCLNFVNTIESSIDNKLYYLIPKPINLIYKLLHKDGEEDKRLKPSYISNTTMQNIFKNFMVVPSKINDYICTILNLEDIENSSSANVSKNIGSRTSNRLEIAIKNESLNVAIFSPSMTIPKFKYITFEEKSNLPLVHIAEIDSNDESEIAESYLEFLDSIIVKDKEFFIILLPELLVYEATRNKIKEWLQNNQSKSNIILLIAGSMHYSKEKEYFNESIVYDYKGNELWKQNKINAFKHNNVREFLNYERKEFICVDTIIGRMSISICVDFLRENYIYLNNSFYVNFHLVPSFSSSTSEFKTHSRVIGRNYNSSTFYCGFYSHSKSQKEKDKVENFIYFPSKSPQISKINTNMGVISKESLLGKNNILEVNLFNLV